MARIRRARGGDAGFRLVEVLVALAVVAVSLGALGAVMFANIRSAGAIEQHLGVTETGRALFAALPDRAAPMAESLAGELDGQRWRLGARPFVDKYVDQASPSPWEPWLVTLRVRSPSGALLQIDTVRLRRRTDR